MNKNFKKLLMMMITMVVLPAVVNAAPLKVGETDYNTLTEAIEGAKTQNKEIVLQENISNMKFDIPRDYDITINLNGKTLTYDVDLGASEEIIINNYGKLKIYGTGNSTLNIKGTIYNAYSILGRTTSDPRQVLDIDVPYMNFNKGNIYNEADVTINTKKTTLTADNGVSMVVNGQYYGQTENFGSPAVHIKGGEYEDKSTLYGLISTGGGVKSAITIDDGIYSAVAGTLISGTTIKINGGKYNTKTNFISCTTCDVSIKNANVEIDGNFIIFDLNGKSNLTIDSGTYKSKGYVAFLHGADSTMTIGKNDNTINDEPTLISTNSISALVFYSTGDTLNFYDGTITATEKNPAAVEDKVKFNTLDSYNVKNNNNGTYTARLKKDKVNEVPSSSENKEVTEGTNTTENEEVKTEETKTEVENPKTGSYLPILVMIVLIVAGVAIILVTRKNKLYKL